MNFASWLFESSASSEREFLVGHGLSAPLSHRECARRAAALAEHVAGRGRARNYVLLANNGPFFVNAYLGTILGGNIIVPLEPRISRRELAAILEACRPAAVLVDAVGSARRDELAGFEVWGEADLPAPAASPPVAGAPVGGDDLAAILFTSGTTGARRGVMLSHGNLRANTEAILDYLHLTRDDRGLVALPFSYCYGASLLHTHLRVGGSLALSNPISLGAVPGEIDTWRCTGFAGVPTTYQILARKSDFLARELPSLRYMTQAGGKLTDELILAFADAFPAKQFYVMYGTTEATARLSYLPPHLVREKLGSVGRGLRGVTLEIVDERGCPVAPGEIGEIAASGPNVMLGYYGDPEGTAQVLRGGRLRTGDLATMDEEGFIRVVGRAKRMIKAAGHRFSPHVVESVLREVEGVADCSVLGVSDPVLGEAVVAVVEASSDREGIESRIRAHCLAELPSFMQPQRVEFVDALPLNASSKVDLVLLRSMIGVAG